MVAAELFSAPQAFRFTHADHYFRFRRHAAAAADFTPHIAAAAAGFADIFAASTMPSLDFAIFERYAISAHCHFRHIFLSDFDADIAIRAFASDTPLRH
jgi:hypothetical protein